jgi:hypothetical protein
MCWHVLGAHTRPPRSGVAIVGLEGRVHHWTLVVDVSARQLTTSDSDSLNRLRRSSCTTDRNTRRYRIPAHSVFLLRLRRPSAF